MLKPILPLIVLLTALAAVESFPKTVQIQVQQDQQVRVDVDVDEDGEEDRKDPFVRDAVGGRGGKTVIEQELIDMYCEAYRAGLRRGRTRCGKDLHPHCMFNGSVILGSCRLKRAVCVENVLEDFDWFSCALP